MHNCARSGCTGSSAIPAAAARMWSFIDPDAPAGFAASPAIADGRVYIGCDNRTLYCLDAKTGRMLWQLEDVHVDMCPAVSSDGVFFGNVYGKSTFFCLDPVGGRVIWQTPAEQEVCGSPSIHAGRVYFGLGNGSFTMSHAKPTGALACLSTRDGKLQWMFRARDTVLTCAAFGDNAGYFGCRDGKLYCVNLTDGRLRWAFTAGEAIVSSPAISGERICFGCDDGQIYCIDGRSGRKLWAYDTSREAFNTDVRIISSPAISGGRVFVGSMNYHLLCLGP